MAPSSPRRRGTAKPAPKAAPEPDPDLNAPEGAKVTEAPDKGLWLALVDAHGKIVQQDGLPVRLR